MSGYTIGAMILGFGSLVLGFIGDNLSREGEKKEIIDEIKEDYVLVPRRRKED